MEGESLLILLIIIGAAVGLFAFLIKRGEKTRTPPTPTVKTAAPGVRPPVTKSPAGAPVVRYPQNAPQPDPVILIFEDRIVRQIRRCPSCDGENPVHAKGCEICGRRL